MTKQEMIEKVNATHRSALGYNFNPAVVAETINTGTIPEGYVLVDIGNQLVKYEDGRVNKYIDGELAESRDDAEAIENALMLYAYKRSNLGVSMGAM